jgi:beta-phosphoglucomutase-like phosphatase (HAD superfamily)
MGKRGRARGRADKLEAPTTDYTDAEGNVLTLRGSMTPKTRVQYAETLKAAASSPAATMEDAWHRAVELLFERLAVRWEVAGVVTERQQELLVRFRVASQAERSWIRDVMRKHLDDYFPDVRRP